MDAIKIDGLSISKMGQTILHDISLELPAGKIIGVLGPSGAGKTTLIRTLVGRQVIEHGTAIVLGLPAGSAGLRSEIGYMPQAPAIYNDLSVLQNLTYFARMKGLGRAEADQVIKQVGLGRQVRQLGSTLSGGQRSRVSLAIALMGKPKLLLLDEPTVGVDPVLRRQLWQMFKELADEGTTLLISSHVMDEASRCDQLLLIRDGRLLAYGTPQELKHRTGTGSVEDSFLKLVEAK